MTRSTEFLELVRERLAAPGAVSARAMFGGCGIYVDSRFCAIVHREVLYLKADARTQAQFEAQGARAFKPLADKPMTLLYYEAPADFFEDDECRHAWGRLAIEAALPRSRTAPGSGRRSEKPAARPAGFRRR